ncbi:HAD family hydrolase [Chengkuizengella axinellae]|uniref:HAD family hydrolase n=1 Tax=Chengkuizengella axinellae TaxID=3064388 RepID=A0ABT9IYK4_9BACL|nr:HAD family hydrolase [Chengkuizengella sp. 2205SS18-9]MDP5274444.1 HAD family hydrolase [Chengkuizengella sp. 2205SS18-9]
MSRSFSPKTKKVIFFDMNNTLIDHQRSFKVSFLSVLEDFTARWDSEQEEWDPNKVYVKYMKELKLAKQDKNKYNIPKNKLQHYCLRQSLKNYPIDVNRGFSEHFFNTIQETRPQNVQLFPDVMQPLDTLSNKYKLAIISNGKKNDYDHLDIKKYIPENQVFTSKMFGHHKPHPTIFQKALNKMDLNPEQSVMVGNSWKNDVCGAIDIGMDAIWIVRKPRKGSRRRADKKGVTYIQSLKELISVFEV